MHYFNDIGMGVYNGYWNGGIAKTHALASFFNHHKQLNHTGFTGLSVNKLPLDLVVSSVLIIYPASPKNDREVTSTSCYQA